MTPRIPLALYARISTAVFAGVPLEEVLRVSGLNPDVWKMEQEAWGAVIANRLGTDEQFQAEYDDELMQARELVHRVIEPLDSDSAAWLRFLSLWGTSLDPNEFLVQSGLTGHDFARLQQKWAMHFFAFPEAQKFELPTQDEPLAPMELRFGEWEIEKAFSEFRQTAETLQDAPPEPEDDEFDEDVEPTIDKPQLFAALPTASDPQESEF